MAYREIIGVGTVLHPDARLVNDPDSEDLTTHAADAAAHGLGLTWEEKYLARGLTRSGLTVGQAGWFFEDFTDIARWQLLLGATAAVAVTNINGGVADFGAIAPAEFVQYVPGSAAFGNPSACIGDGPFYVAARFRIPAGGIPADGEMDVGFMEFGAGQFVLAGYAPIVDAVHFSLSTWNGVGGDSVSSAIAVDANWHDLEAWSDGVNYYLSVDGETAMTLVPVAVVNVPLSPIIQMIAGAAANSHTYLDKYLCVFPQAA